MRKIRCPKCDKFLTFDETNYHEGDTLVFVCEHCSKQFSIRIIKKKTEKKSEKVSKKIVDFGKIVVLENVFGFKQEFKLVEGDNVFGRRSKGTDINQPIETSDRSIDRIHCIINVSRNKNGKLIYTLRDAPSITGTFLMNEILGDKDRVYINNGAIISIGAASLIFHAGKEDSEQL